MSITSMSPETESLDYIFVAGKSNVSALLCVELQKNNSVLNANPFLLTPLASVISGVAFGAFNESASRCITHKSFYMNGELASTKGNASFFY